MRDIRESQKVIRAFIVDDDKDSLAVVSHQFRNLKVDVTGVSDSTAALEEFLKNSTSVGGFDIVVLDIRMPNLNGYDLSRQIRETGYAGLIVALTASTTGEGRRESKESGIDYYFNKTSISKELVAALLRGDTAAAFELEDRNPDLDE